MPAVSSQVQALVFTAYSILPTADFKSNEGHFDLC